MTKITILGGGSYTWGPTFMRDIFATPELAGSRLVLHDIVQNRMDLVYALGQKMIRDFTLDFHLEKTLSLDESLQGADFVILTITTGRLDSMRPDLEIPVKYGIKQPVGDTTGPGGLSRALRNIPVVAEIGRKVMEICPDALFLNYTNPMTVLTRTLAMQGVKVVGLCHEWIGVREKLAQIFSTNPESITARIAGVNHLIWVTDLYVEGKPVWDELPALTDKILSGKIKVDGEDTSVFADHAKVKSTLFKLYGALPAAGDRHVAEFFPHFINESTHWGADYDVNLTSIEDRMGLEAFARMMIESVIRGETSLWPFMQDVSTEAANKIIRAVTCGKKYRGIMNLPNVGQIDNLARDAVVETYGVIDAVGANAIAYGEVPAGVQNLVGHHVCQQEMTVQAALTGSREIALQVLLNDPLSSRLTVSQARQMMEELLEANKQYLGLFF
jgi:alpha-galactosidase/6-phospho-beta-glucosidase family protein